MRSLDATSTPAGRDVPGLSAPDEMRRLLDRAVAASANGIVITDPKLPDNPIVYVNPAFERISGYGAEEVRGRNCRFLQGEERDQPALDELRTALREERESRVVLRNYRKDGEPFWNELYVSPVHDDGGRLTNFLGVQNDITERRRIEEILRESEERFRATFEHAAVGAAQVGIDGRWLRVNRRLCEIVGYTHDEMLGMTFADITHPEDLEADLEQTRAMLRGESQTYTMEKRYVRKDGRTVWVNLTVSLVREASGEPRYFIAVVEDISERKRIEEERDLLLVREQLARAEAVAARRRLALLAAAGPMLSASLDYEDTLRRATRLLVPDLADWCLIDIAEEDGRVNQLAAAHADPEKEELLPRLGEHRTFGEDDPGSTAQVLRTGRSVLLSGLPDGALYGPEVGGGEHLKVLRELEPRSLMSVPLLARGRTLGAMTLVSSRPDRRYDDEDLLLAENLAYRCALAVDNARLYRDRSEIARTLQRSLLPPHLPEIPGVELGAEYLPAGEANEVGGDFYDVINTVEDGWICAIGDVRGKGAEAAAVTALARYTIRAVTMSNDLPSAILSGLNEAMVRQLPEDRFCTAACARLEPLDDDPGVGVDVSRAGHPPPLVVRADGTVEEISCPGRALGVFPDAELGDTHMRLMPGETMVFYTDGVTEARSPDGSFFGEERLRRFVAVHADEHAADLAAELKSAVLKFQEGYARDDLALLVLRAT
ncbi:MAG: Serine phosphatase RsbU, regulator of sigma subunit [uncultured Rubrobacteraceae bacterium]|uniref:Serine phosphatase RsbU, regulator of sigma subunit n=1 Tax=uncultured Rubrobacteraceae bacterium TaxID=349277 RepID=A0A6J4TDA8_9ACTN|nr:MAG: Serine phosphatase RsbU, regulator of sigma subunit [uncultured Rubrobacteraceae bacterium]